MRKKGLYILALVGILALSTSCGKNNLKKASKDTDPNALSLKQVISDVNKKMTMILRVIKTLTNLHMS